VKLPTVQILLSTYNGEKYIDEQINSLLLQEGVDISIIIRDDGSSDGTLEKLEIFKQRYPQRFVVFQERNIGVVNSFFDLIHRTSNQFNYYAFCDQDDIWKSDKLIRAISYLQDQKKEVPLMYCSSTLMVDQELVPIKTWPPIPLRELTIYNALVENVCVGCTIVINSTALDIVKKNPLNRLHNVIMHDWWIYLCVSSLGKVYFDEEPSILYRQHPNNIYGGLVDGVMPKWKKRISRFVEGRNYYILSKQAHEFLLSYSTLLDARIKNDILQFLSSQNKNIVKRINYIRKSPFYKHSSIDNLIYKFLFILGKL
jgi:glycosyltransferase involved in cell wall biosynthesis